MTYKQLTEVERYPIFSLKKAGFYNASLLNHLIETHQPVAES